VPQPRARTTKERIPVAATANPSIRTHLRADAEAMLHASVEDRIRFIRSERWIGYTRAHDILKRLEDLLSHPPINRMPNLLIVGDSNNGKTEIIRRFQQLHPPSDGAGTDAVVLPAMIVQAPPVPDEGRFYNNILELICAPYKPTDRVEIKQAQVLRLLRHIGVRILAIDEIHQLTAGNLNKQRQFLNVLKFLGNELRIPLVAVGTHDAFHAFNTDPQFASRFEAMQVPRWQSDKEYYRLLASFELLLPLKRPSHLIDPALANRIYGLAEGMIGDIAELLRRTAVDAIRSGAECIDIATLAKVEWTPPSKRKQYPSSGG
jgi:hypothetical protein